MAPLRDFPEESLMPLWMEILINFIGYAGFFGIAMFNKTSDETRTDQP
jgi:hypothetical protein